ncbi:serine hydrolase domain-containing protein [Roseateles violae]|uniref:Serine hydrolase domain-containing protein n=1 Tax=Roseateles violae TaxID=3058042 RepID=A0ABT8DQM8_9BURK|nr:serine hydrolase domain-containing protein [Pelomonas sp. PFR6]MDN3920316.1 serine hydrolase domain-containing protein [Pelomonas sp. PFR6]
MEKAMSAGPNLGCHPDALRRRLLSLPLLAAMPALAQADGLRDLLNDPANPLASLSVLVQREGRTVYEGCFGRRYIAPAASRRDLPVTVNTLFRMASVSKLVVALAALRLVEAGRFDLDADIGATLGFALRHPDHPQQPITARLLLSHRSSLLDDGDSYADTGMTLQRHVQRGLRWAAAAPGRHFQYCNFNYVVLAGAMERASGLRFDRLMQEQVLGPLGMQGSFDVHRLRPAQLAELATLYRRHPDGRWIAQVDDYHAAAPKPPPLPADYVPGSRPALFAPQGGLRTRVRDLAAAMAMLTNGGVHKGGRFLQQSSIDAMLSEHWRHDAPSGNGDDLGGLFQAWGLGVQHFIDRSGPSWGDRLTSAGGLQAWGHLGEAYGLLSGLIFEPSRRIGVVYAIGGIRAGSDALHGRYSSFSPAEERLLALLWKKLL